MSAMYRPILTQPKILCAICGNLTVVTPSNLCNSCIRSQVDITEGIPKSETLYHCKGCDKYFTPPATWTKAELESAELLALCLKKIKGLNSVRLVGAQFVWTEPHSKRIKVRLTIQKEALSSIVQQVFVVEFTVAGQYCSECKKVDANQTWNSVVQVRQRVAHKKTLMWLEQLILKYQAHKNTTNIKECKDGIDFYFSQKSHAVQMSEFLQSIVPTKVAASEHLISKDVHTGKKTYKFTFSVTIAPVCKDDLICVSSKLSNTLSGVFPLCLCTKICNSIMIMDLETLKFAEIRAQKYWESQSQIDVLFNSRKLETFYVIDVQVDRKNLQSGKNVLAIVEMCPENSIDRRIITKTNLGHIIKPGDYVLGYDLKNANYNSNLWDKLITDPKLKDHVPEAVIVRKTYQKTTGSRIWKLKKLDKQDGDAPKGNLASSHEAEYESFLREIEESPDMRAEINLYKDQDVIDRISRESGKTETGEENQASGISINELHDDFQKMSI